MGMRVRDIEQSSACWLRWWGGWRSHRCGQKENGRVEGCRFEGGTRAMRTELT